MNLGEFKRAGHWPTLLCSLLYFDTSFMVWTLMGALGVFIAQGFHLTPAQAGLLVAIPLLGGSILRIIMGVASDHFGPRRVGLAGLTVTLVPLCWGWLHSNTIGDLVGIGLLLGIAGASFAVALPLASRCIRRSFRGSRWASPVRTIRAPCWRRSSRPPRGAIRMARGIQARDYPDPLDAAGLLAVCAGKSG